MLHTGARVKRFEEKAAFAPLAGLSDMPTPQVAPADALRKSDVLDLTSKMKPDGSLDWTPPAGQWIVLRMGYSLLGITNHPASPEGTGLEVDKLNPEYVKAYMDDVPGQLQERRRTADGCARPALPDQRQLGSRRAELDRPDDRRVHAAARLRSASVAADAHRPRRRKRGGLAIASCGISGERSRTCWRSTTTIRSPRS